MPAWYLADFAKFRMLHVWVSSTLEKELHLVCKIYLSLNGDYLAKLLASLLISFASTSNISKLICPSRPLSAQPPSG